MKYLMMLVFVLSVVAYAQETPVTTPAVPALTGDEKELLEILSKFAEDNADCVKLSMALLPTEADFKAVFTADACEKYVKFYEKFWKRNVTLIVPGEAEERIVCWKASVEELGKEKWEGEAKHFAKNYKKVLKVINPNITFFCGKFVKPPKEEQAADPNQKQSWWSKIKKGTKDAWSKAKDTYANITGTTFDGFVFVNGHWVIFPAPWDIQAAIEKAEKAEKK